MNAQCDKCHQKYDVPDGMDPQCPWCPSPAEKKLPKIPRQIGKYEILEQIGVGGMGVVYRARHTELKNTVALKVMVAGEHASEETLLRFQREARSAAALHHPNIAPVFDVGQVEPLYYIVMEYVEGKNLDQRSLEESDPKEAARIARDVARALAYAHERNIVHRDVKPGNILVDQEGNAKLVDFGLAKSLLDDKTLTRTGEIIGTASYMPPEQVIGSMKEVDERSDIYSLGTVLYELLSGQPAYAADTLIMTIRLIEESTPSPLVELDKNVPRELETICFKAMAREKSRRYQTAAEFADDLDRFLNGEPIAARRSGFFHRTTRWVRRQPALSTAMAMSFLFVAIATGLLLGGNPPGINRQDQLKRALPHLESARHEIEKAARYTARARSERRDVLKKAVAELDAAIAIYPEYADAFYYRGAARIALAKPGLARKDIDEAIRLDPNHAEAYYARIQLRLKSLRQKRLLGTLQTSPDIELQEQERSRIKKDISFLQGLSGRPELALTAEAALENFFDQGTRAMTLSNQALKHNRAFADALVIRASTWQRKALFEEKESGIALERALKDCDLAILSEVNNVEAYRVRAEVYLALGQYDDAIGDLEEMKAIAPEEIQTYIDRVLVLNKDPKPVRSRDQIRADLDRAVQLDPVNPNTRFLRAVHIINTPKSEDKFRQARKDLDVALRSDPEYFPALIVRMICHSALNDEKALERDKDKMRELLASFSAEEIARIRNKILEYVKLRTRYVKLPPTVLMSRDASQYLELGEFRKAGKEYRRILRRLTDPDISGKEGIPGKDRERLRQVAHYNLACIHSLSGRPENGLVSLRNALEAGYRDFDHIRSDDDLEEVRNLPEFSPLLDRFRK